ncbi:MAG TPA: DNA-deoxyinosine glycosylase [Candidatus Eisenbergiella merdavium]|uniref:DNA-deoxyinosine glycosylase n=1 Tax=Candidatus Eisenbergiella merdavium TaxID=2838551 RepID=A0A9D2SP59_9FIRM|nr:DNA-deoxyinosine glycosylase [Candidatus Eisenbergiella merdavium]
MNTSRKKEKAAGAPGPEAVVHEFPPVYDADSRILILGTFPSVKSREQHFYYGHPQNRFWQVIAALTGSGTPESIEEKKTMLLKNGIAVWDVIASCRITGSSDSSIRDVKANDIAGLLQKSRIRAVYANGTTAFRLYEKYCFPQTGLKAVCLPSTSPANAAWTLPKLLEAWKVILKD